METTLLKGLKLLEILAARVEPAGVTALAGQLGLVKSNVHRLLQALIAAGYVYRTPEGGRYICSLRLWELGSRVGERFDVARVARPHMAELARRTSETVNLSILDGGEVVYIDKIDSTLPVRADTRIGGRAPAYCSATGKALLAFSPPEVIDAACTGMRSYTPRTVSGRAALERDLKRIRSTGYAATQGEWREGVAGIAAPVLGPGGGLIAAVGLGGPIERLARSRVRQLAPLVIGTASAIARSMGLRRNEAAMPMLLNTPGRRRVNAPPRAM